MQVVEARAIVGQACVWCVRLPDRIGAPQALLHGCWIEAVGFLELALAIGLTHQPLFAVEEVTSLGGVSLLHALGNSAPERVIPVAGLQARAALPLVRCLIPRQPLGRVVLVALFPLRAGFLARVPLRRVADRGVDGCCLAERCGSGVLRELVVPVVAPGAGLMPAAGAVVHRVVVVLLMGQTQRLQGLIRLGADQSTELVIAIVGRAQIALDLHDVARLSAVRASFCSVMRAFARPSMGLPWASKVLV